MVIMPDNWPLGTRQVSFIGVCCLDGGGRGERVTEQEDRRTNHETEAEKEGKNSEWRLFEWQTEMDVKMGFWEIMNLHILIEKCMLRLSTKKKRKSCTTHLQNYRMYVTWLCVSLFVWMLVFERDITELYFKGCSPLKLSSMIKIVWVIS